MVAPKRFDVLDQHAVNRACDAIRDACRNYESQLVLIGANALKDEAREAA